MTTTVTYMNTSQGATKAPADTEIAERITNALIIKKINVRALSEETGISYPTLRRSLSGGRSLTFQEFDKIASALKVQPSTLLPESFVAVAA